MRPRGSPLELEHRRILAVQRALEGFSSQEVAEFLDADASSIRRWLRAFHCHGVQGLMAHPVPGRPAKLSRTQEKIIYRWLRDPPSKYGYSTELWTSARLTQLIREEFQIHFHPDYLTHWLREHGFTPQKPQRVPRQRNPQEIAAWIAKDWPRIKQNALRKKALIALIDESGLLMAPLLKRTWAVRGERPILLQEGGHRNKVSIAGAFLISPQHKKFGFFFKTLINDYFNNFYVVAFIEAILKIAHHNVIIVWDRGPNHGGDAIRELQTLYGRRLMLEPLPSYAPMLNPHFYP